MSKKRSEGVLRAASVTRRFGDVTAVDSLSLTLERGEFVTLLGPSGCGKTTALRLIAGFERPDEGSVVFDGNDVTGWNPQRRGFGMVFQNYALFPHLNVFENVAFGLRARKASPDRIRERVASTLRIVDLSGYAERAVQALSGGQQQRVALARALAIEPPLLLLDEPLSNLDQALRVQTRNDLRRLVKELGITALFVTHDQEEAFDLSDRIAVMNAGRVRQIGTPRRLYEEPADRFVAGFVGRANALLGRCLDEGVRVTEEVAWRLPRKAEERAHGGGPAVGAPCVVLLRPEDLEIDGDADGSDEASETGRGSLAGTVEDRRFRGGSVVYRVRVKGARSPGAGSKAGATDGVVLEVLTAAEGPDVGQRARVRPKAGARFHVFPHGGTG